MMIRAHHQSWHLKRKTLSNERIYERDKKYANISWTVQQQILSYRSQVTKLVCFSWLMMLIVLAAIYKEEVCRM